MLLHLPGELRNQVYECVAYGSMEAVMLEPGFAKITLPPLSLVCRQVYHEFGTLYSAIPLSYATNIIVYNDDFNIWSLLHTIRSIPSPAPNVECSTVLRIGLTNSLELVNVKAFITELARSQLQMPLDQASKLRYCFSFDLETFDLHTWRLHFARLAKQYRFHRSDSEQRVFESIYWEFARKAEKVDGVSVKQYAMGYWNPGARLCFV
ncbi:hypothetical protein LTR78_006665 [Recurvomyces mirabilis]|uniref:Uncharacterized protein n=1 Tax=Recurvomyces mirabilis TaxID=574656 RepID=A0AAE1BZJ7_9PEZI|nr:hypothetical protein LTR78_006665 [Recurvomyces mirabilis]KAK5151446.1 hypothetical protein LTS14_009289 [Recurvomyces mirabilis]